MTHPVAQFKTSHVLPQDHGRHSNCDEEIGKKKEVMGATPGEANSIRS